MAERHALGFIYKSGECSIKRFLRDFKEPADGNTEFTKDYVLEHIHRQPNQSVNTVRRYVSAVNCFLNFAIRKGIRAYVIPVKVLPKEKKDFKARIFTDDEIARLLAAADSIPFIIQNLDRIYQIPIMFRILINCGLRTAELLNLRMCDVDLNENAFTVLDTKFHKNRFVPFSNAVADALKLYLSKVKPRHENDWLFRSPKTGDRYSGNMVNAFFREILRRAGIPHGGHGHGPRPHDLRHTFAVHCLNNWVLSDVDLTAALPVLSRYMGHSGINGTQKYLQLTAEMYPDIVTRLEEKFGNLIPSMEVQHEAK
ncbi:tyrosine-type recombinase/integrase [Pseudobacteroides cellulosolvens]|nr:tyrosine-type recombinase/integrase [Pseudobacteroides cellulosolvens]